MSPLKSGGLTCLSLVFAGMWERVYYIMTMLSHDFCNCCVHVALNFSGYNLSFGNLFASWIKVIWQDMTSVETTQRFQRILRSLRHQAVCRASFLQKKAKLTQLFSQHNAAPAKNSFTSSTSRSQVSRHSMFYYRPTRFDGFCFKWCFTCFVLKLFIIYHFVQLRPWDRILYNRKTCSAVFSLCAKGLRSCVYKK